MDIYTQLVTVGLPAALALIVATKKILVAVNSAVEELKPNGGASLRDAVDNIKQSVNSLKSEFRGHVDLGPGGAFVTDNNGECIWVSKGWKELTGLTSEQALGSGWIAGIHKDDQLRVFDEWALSCRNPLIQFSSTYKTATGVRVRARSVNLKSDLNENSGFLGLLTPVCLPECPPENTENTEHAED